MTINQTRMTALINSFNTKLVARAKGKKKKQKTNRLERGK